MSAVWVRARSEMRARWRASLALALVLGVGAGASLAAWAGARRTSSAYPRFLATHDAADLITGGAPESIDIEKAFDAIERFPQVAETARIQIVSFEAKLGSAVVRMPEFFGAVVDRGSFLVRFNRAKLITGRLPDPRAADEALISFVTAERYRLRTGDRVTLTVGDPFSPQAQHVPVRVVGIEASPGEFQGVGVSPTVGGFWLARAFYERFRQLIPPRNGDTYSLAVRLKRGPADLPAFVDTLAKTPHASIDIVATKPVHLADVQKSMRVYAVALWLLGAIGALVVLGVIGQLLAREILLQSDEHSILRALGMGRRELIILGLARAVALALAAAPIAIAFAFALSPLTPIGVARVAEPAPGLSFDGLTLGLGAAALIASVCGMAVWPSWRAARGAGLTGAVAGVFERPSLAAGAAVRASASASAVTGLRMALEPGRGRTAVPVRTSIVSITLALTALIASAIVGSSLNKLLDTPALSGSTYDALVFGPEEEGGRARDTVRRVLAETKVAAAVSDGNVGNAMIGGRELFVLVLPESGPIGFATIDGRAPTDQLHDGIPEIALGPATLRRTKWRIGQRVAFTVPDPVQEGVMKQATFLIVGSVAIPPIPFGSSEPGDGVAMTFGGFHVIAPSNDTPCCFVRFNRGIGIDTARKRLESEGLGVAARSQRGDLVTLSRVNRLPAVLAYMLGTTAALTLAYALITSISRRRRDLAILKTLGFVRGQVRRTVAWQGSALALVAGFLAIPAGVALGRYAWRLFADQFGVVPRPQVPLVLLLEIVPAAVILANVIALLPARAAARTQPALVLRTE